MTLHTDVGDLKIEIFCEGERCVIHHQAVPKTSENFMALCASNYYDNSLFHRNMKGFMVQTGDPSGTGKGGDCIWGGSFDDEIRPTLKVFSLLIHPVAQRKRNSIHG